MRAGSIVLAALALGACAPHRAPVAFELRGEGPSSTSATSPGSRIESYSRVNRTDAAILGCDAAPQSPVCEVGMPTAEEDSAFRAEGERLAAHADARCRKLGEAIAVYEPEVRMYRKALVKWTGIERLFGVGHAFEVNEAWNVRVARRIDDLNERTLEEKKRTLRHEMSHTIGATETPGAGWTAEDYASNCG